MNYTSEQIALQTFLANGAVPKGSVSFATSIAYAKNATPKQLHYVNQIVQQVLDSLNEKPVFDDAMLFTLFDNALKHLKYPKINLRTPAGKHLRLTVSRKNPDTCWLSVNGYGTDTYGRICRGDGKIIFSAPGRAIADDLNTILSEFCADPVGVSHAYGKLTHNCCYCSKALDTPESLAVGYGPVCAKHYGLAWGGKTTRVKPIVDELVTTFKPSEVLAQHVDELDFEQKMEDEYAAEMFEFEVEHQSIF